MSQFKDLFGIIDQENKLFHAIKQKSSKEDKIRANMLFYYHFYNALYGMSDIRSDMENTRKALYYFITITDPLNPAIAVINNAYQMCTMIDREQLTNILMGGQTSFLDLKPDAAKLGALLALNFKFTSYTKFDMLSETLFYS